MAQAVQQSTEHLNVNQSDEGGAQADDETPDKIESESSFVHRQICLLFKES